MTDRADTRPELEKELKLATWEKEAFHGIMDDIGFKVSPQEINNCSPQERQRRDEIAAQDPQIAQVADQHLRDMIVAGEVTNHLKHLSGWADSGIVAPEDRARNDELSKGAEERLREASINGDRYTPKINEVYDIYSTSDVIEGQLSGTTRRQAGEGRVDRIDQSLNAKHEQQTKVLTEFVAKFPTYDKDYNHTGKNDIAFAVIDNGETKDPAAYPRVSSGGFEPDPKYLKKSSDGKGWVSIDPTGPMHDLLDPPMLSAAGKDLVNKLNAAGQANGFHAEVLYENIYTGDRSLPEYPRAEIVAVPNKK